MGQNSSVEYRKARTLPGIGHVGSYQVSGKPFVTGSTALANGAQAQIKFPQVARSVTVINDAATDIRISFTDKDQGNTHTGKHYINLTEARDSMTMNIKCKEIFIYANGGVAQFTVFAELTHIPTGSMYDLTGSGITE
tara:strand:+ start:871 stop:1284 length:414 start_codon:yes stop_codon:yes gene_type:complete